MGGFPVRPKLSDELLIPGDLLQSEPTMTLRGGAGQQFALLFLVDDINKKKYTGKKIFSVIMCLISTDLSFISSTLKICKRGRRRRVPVGR